ncbi:hypothetical protein FQR65_LT04018 [Abscondita terminalis]|nr:hypothetical protein FQR65_LT04018 [Abscondita terminalis]
MGESWKQVLGIHKLKIFIFTNPNVGTLKEDTSVPGPSGVQSKSVRPNDSLRPTLEREQNVANINTDQPVGQKTYLTRAARRRINSDAELATGTTIVGPPLSSLLEALESRGRWSQRRSGTETGSPTATPDPIRQHVYHSNHVTNPNEITGGEELAIAGVELATISAELGDVPAQTPPTLSGYFASTVITRF